jgi:hypothetical protein
MVSANSWHKGDEIECSKLDWLLMRMAGMCYRVMCNRTLKSDDHGPFRPGPQQPRTTSGVPVANILQKPCTITTSCSSVPPPQEQQQQQQKKTKKKNSGNGTSTHTRPPKTGFQFLAL